MTKNENSGELLVFVGSYCAPGDEGIHLLRFDSATGALERIAAASGLENPTFLAVDMAERRLYAVSETVPDGHVAAYRFDPQAGTLEEINRQPSYGGYPCHLQLHPSGKWLIIANYQGGSAVCVYPVMPDGGLGQVVSQSAHAGSGVFPGRQEEPHPHCVFRIPGTDNYLVCDLGIDRVVAYRLDPENGQLSKLGETATFAGGGPRHLAFHPTLPLVYVIHELGAAITVYRLVAESGALEFVQRVSTLPDGQEPSYRNGEICAEIVVSDTGEFVYGSNRQHDSIVAFRADADGRLTAAGHTPSGGHTPRNFSLVPGGKFLLVANQDSNRITVHGIAADGRPEPTGLELEVALPAFVKAFSAQ